MEKLQHYLLTGLIPIVLTAYKGQAVSTQQLPDSTMQIEYDRNQRSTLDLNENFLPIFSRNNLNIYQINNCGYFSKTNIKNITLLDGKHPINGAWNHIDNGPAWQGLSKPVSHYKIDRLATTHDISCNNVATYNNVLVKKYGDWTHQHGNGFSIKSQSSLTFSELKSLTLDIYYDSEKSHLPTRKDIAAAYPTLTKKQLAEWDEGIFQLKIQLSDKTGNFHAAVNLALPPNMANKWLRIEIPVESLDIWRSEGYTKFDIDLAELSDKTFDKVNFVAETKNLKVYRNYDNQGFNIVSTAKLFKEIAFRIKHLEIKTE